MWKKIAATTAALCCIGCVNNNSITVDNNASEAIDFNFRAQIFTINAGESKPLPTDIPNGTYEVNLGTYVPQGTKTWTITPQAASFTFLKNNTKYRCEFGSSFDGSTYAVTWNYTSTDSVSSVGTGQ
ncbi:MAG TPA: hypothetical protein VLX68_09110 [Chitinivibrionales bacterium]|nr:hypothetical protein [Chitinivibrionales bacterium]